MEAPITRDEFLERHEPWLTADLAIYLDAASRMFGQVELYTYDTDDWGWTILYTPAICPAEALPHLAQYVGEEIPFEATEADARQLIADRPHMKRCTPQAILDAVKPYLTGSKIVQLTERYQGVADQLLVNTYDGSTPNPAAVLERLKAVIPADVRLTYLVTVGQIWNTVKVDYAKWSDVKAAYPTWWGVASDQPGV